MSPVGKGKHTGEDLKRDKCGGRGNVSEGTWRRERECGVLEVGKGLGKGTDQVQKVRLQMQASTYPVMMSCEPW